MAPRLPAVLKQLEAIILGKPVQIRQALSCLLAQGHLLIEDLPGVGKTTLAHALARTLGLKFQRVQFTSDLLPADLTGVSIYDRENQRFQFHHGPLFTQLLLADEINRASPKTQSALLEAMEEGQVTADGTTWPLPEPFFVIATQNPSHQIGTFLLPESQLDRFLMRIELGYPDTQAERAMLAGSDRRHLIESLTEAISSSDLQASQQIVRDVYIAPALLDYVQMLIAASRQPGRFMCGLSPRAALGLLHAAQAWAWLDGRDLVLPEDIQAVFLPVSQHRLVMPGSGKAAIEMVRALILETPIP
ncbi:AAA family ATPase [Iodobacter fluviatilis]|uniref:MoxR-like ATPase n=1 Tax=Iodobacter fluviatilis TaxID=537 RepID=A0A377Q8K1_9NEIS|nr:MoxR family ATPase [Iodobacter fluviatilis]TCU89529.1 MoxR-like ATPase [Iodobacter fluviatilis]STQ90899.1 recombination factor protein RarA [Iodobacter fluviatilis]